MKARELIEKLQKVDPEMEVTIPISGLREDNRFVYWDGDVESVWTETNYEGIKYLYIGQIDTASTELTINEL